MITSLHGIVNVVVKHGEELPATWQSAL